VLLLVDLLSVGLPVQGLLAMSLATLQTSPVLLLLPTVEPG